MLWYPDVPELPGPEKDAHRTNDWGNGSLGVAPEQPIKIAVAEKSKRGMRIYFSFVKSIAFFLVNSSLISHPK